jgi:hypothetical protein
MTGHQEKTVTHLFNKVLHDTGALTNKDSMTEIKCIFILRFDDSHVEMWLKKKTII